MEGSRGGLASSQRQDAGGSPFSSSFRSGVFSASDGAGAERPVWDHRRAPLPAQDPRRHADTAAPRVLSSSSYSQRQRGRGGFVSNTGKQTSCPSQGACEPPLPAGSRPLSRFGAGGSHPCQDLSFVLSVSLSVAPTSGHLSYSSAGPDTRLHRYYAFGDMDALVEGNCGSRGRTVDPT